MWVGVLLSVWKLDVGVLFVSQLVNIQANYHRQSLKLLEEILPALAEEIGNQPCSVRSLLRKEFYFMSNCCQTEEIFLPNGPEKAHTKND